MSLINAGANARLANEKAKTSNLLLSFIAFGGKLLAFERSLSKMPVLESFKTKFVSKSLT